MFSFIGIISLSIFKFELRLPSAFMALILVTLAHFFVYSAFNTERFTTELLSLARESLIILMAAMFSVSIFKKTHLNFLTIIFLIFIVIDIIQANQLIQIPNPAMEQYYSEINITLELPRYVYYRDHVSFTPLMVFLLCILNFWNRNFFVNTFILLGLFLFQSRTYAIYLIMHYWEGIRKNFNVFFMLTVFSLLAGLIVFNYFPDILPNVRLINALTSPEEFALLAIDILLRLDNWEEWLNLVLSLEYPLGIGSYGIANKSMFVSLSEVYAIDNIFLRELVRYGFFGVFRLFIYGYFFISTFGIKFDKPEHGFALLARYILIASLFNDLYADVIVRLVLFISLSVVLRSKYA